MSGFDGGDMLDMQNRIGSYSSLKRRLSGANVEVSPSIEKLSKFKSSDDSLYGELLPGDLSYCTRAQSTQESLSGIDMQLFSEEDLHQ